MALGRRPYITSHARDGQPARSATAITLSEATTTCSSRSCCFLPLSNRYILNQFN